MKKIIIFILGVFTFISCSEFLEEDTSSVISVDSDALTTEQGLFAALVGTYKPMSHTWNKGYGTAATQGVLMGSDDLTTHKAANKAEFREFDQYKITETNSRMLDIWKGAYKSIQGSNNIIANYEKALGNETTINQIAGEAYFLRGFNYFWIVRLWGEAPLLTTSQIFDEKLLELEKSSIDAIYSRIIEDLEMAEILLGDKKPQPGRVNKGAAKALLAMTYLHMTGYPVNDASKYTLAASKAKEVIDAQATFGFGLMNNFADIWDAANNGNSEEVFALNFWGSQGYNANSMFGNSARPGDEGGWDDYFSEITFFNEFPAGVRKDATFQTELADGTPWTSFMRKRPYFKKMQGPDKSWKNAVSLPLIRMAEVYLIYAEAMVMSTNDTTNTEALDAINKIVRRANGFPPNAAEPTIDLTSVTQRRIIDERSWEFAAEFVRWFDLVRLQMVEEVIAKKDSDELEKLGEVQYFFPIPASETLANPKLKD